MIRLVAATESLPVRLQIVAIIVSGGMLLVVLEMVRRRRLMERYSLLWLFSAFVLLLLAVFSGILGKLSSAAGIATPSNALFLVAFGFVILMLLHFSATFSRLSDQTKVLAQSLASLEERLRRLEPPVSVSDATSSSDSEESS